MGLNIKKTFKKLHKLLLITFKTEGVSNTPQGYR